MSRHAPSGRKVLLPPINFIFKLLQQHSTVQIWLYEQLGIRIEGKIRGFDEFMNLVLDEAVEVKQATKQDPHPEQAEGGGRRKLGQYRQRRETRDYLLIGGFAGQILLKGDNVALIQSLD